MWGDISHFLPFAFGWLLTMLRIFPYILYILQKYLCRSFAHLKKKWLFTTLELYKYPWSNTWFACELIFLYYIWNLFHYFVYECPVFLTSIERVIISPLCIVTLLKISWAHKHEFISRIYFVQFIYMSIFYISYYFLTITIIKIENK